MRSVVHSTSIAFSLVALVFFSIAFSPSANAQTYSLSEMSERATLIERVLNLVDTLLRAQASGAQPELSVNTFTRSPATDLTAGTVVYFSATVRNDGANNPYGPWARFCIDNGSCLYNDTGHIGGDPLTSPLDAGAVSTTYTREWSATEGLHTAYFCVNTGNPPVPELVVSTSSNCKSMSFYVSPAQSAPSGQPNLRPINLRTSHSSPVPAGTAMTFSAAVYNDGSAPAPDSWARFCIDSASENDCYTQLTTRLGSGHRLSEAGLALPERQSSRTMTSLTWSATAGTHTVYFCADPTPGAQVGESDENDNCTSTTFTVSSPQPVQTVTPPDLIGVSITRLPSGTVTEGQTVSFTGTAKNNGGTQSSRPWARFCLNNANCLNNDTGYIGVDPLLPELSPGGSSSQTRNWVAVPGTYTAYFCVNTGNPAAIETPRTFESNCESLSFTVSPMQPTVAPQPQPSTATPDLIVESMRRSPSTTITPGTPVTFYATVRNREGNAAASSGRFCLNSPDCSAGTVGNIHSAPALDSGDYAPTASYTWTQTVNASYTMYFCADVGRTVPEITDSNNCNSVFVQVSSPTQPPPPVVEVPPVQTPPPTQTPQTPTAPVLPDLSVADFESDLTGTLRGGGTVRFTGSARNEGGGLASGTVGRFCVNNANCIGSQLGKIPDDRFLGALSSGARSSDVSVSWTFPNATAIYTVYFCVDATRAVNESLETNNCRPLTVSVEATGVTQPQQPQPPVQTPTVPPVVVPPTVPDEAVVPLPETPVGGTAEFGFTVQMQGSTNSSAGPTLGEFKESIDDIAGKVTWVRVYVQEWDTMLDMTQFPSITFNQPFIDRYKEALQYARSKGLKIQLNVTPRLNARAQSFSHSDYLELTRLHMEYLAGQFAPYVDVWQVANEANITNFRTGTHMWESNWTLPALPSSYLNELRDVMMTARAAIRKHSLSPITTSISGWPRVSEGETELTLQRLYTYIDAILPALDRIGMDVYPPGPEMDANYQRAFDQLPYFFAQLRNRYPGKLVYVAETGIASEGPGRSESQQAEILPKLARSLSAISLSPILFYEHRDSRWTGIGTGDFVTTENSFGIVTGSDSRKPAYRPTMDYLSSNNRRSNLSAPTVLTPTYTPQTPVVESPAPQPQGTQSDLTVHDLKRISGTPTVGAPVSFTAVVRNSGNTADTSYARFCVDNRDCDDSETGRLSFIDPLVGAFIGAGNAVVSGVWTPTTGGSHTMTVCADVQDMVSESSEENNCQTIEFSVSGSTSSAPAPQTPAPALQTPTPAPNTSALCTVVSITDSQAQALGLDADHDKYCDYKGMRFSGSSAVSNGAIEEAVRITAGLLERRADVISNLNSKRHRVLIIGDNEVLTDVPEYRNLYIQFPGTDWNERARGLGATEGMPFSSAGEENLLCYSSGDRYRGESVYIHEFAHSILNLGLGNTFIDRVKAAYGVAKNAGLWGNTYAFTNHEEYWAEGVQSFFNSNLQSNPPNNIHNHVNTRSELQQYDLNLYNLVNEAFAGTSFNYSCPK